MKQWWNRNKKELTDMLIFLLVAAGSVIGVILLLTYLGEWFAQMVR